MSNKLIDLNALSAYKTQSDLKYQDKLTAGSNISINNNTISATDTTYSDATTASAGLMSVVDKTKLDSLILYTAGSNITISGSTISATDTTYSDASTASSGLMSSADKTKLDGLTTYSAGTGIAISTAGVISVSYPNIDNQSF